jgi:pantetheine-phosphate adenylyltransferase
MHQIDIVIRGLRASMDFEYEMQMANINARMWQNVETIFLMSRPDYTFVSSSTVKELYAFNGDIRGLVPESVLGYMEKKYDR